MADADAHVLPVEVQHPLAVGELEPRPVRRDDLRGLVFGGRLLDMDQVLPVPPLNQAAIDHPPAPSVGRRVRSVHVEVLTNGR